MTTKRNGLEDAESGFKKNSEYSLSAALQPRSCVVSLSVGWSLFHREFRRGSLIGRQPPPPRPHNGDLLLVPWGPWTSPTLRHIETWHLRACLWLCVGERDTVGVHLSVVVLVTLEKCICKKESQHTFVSRVGVELQWSGPNEEGKGRGEMKAFAVL